MDAMKFLKIKKPRYPEQMRGFLQKLEARARIELA
jgi:hypothetical protein